MCRLNDRAHETKVMEIDNKSSMDRNGSILFTNPRISSVITKRHTSVFIHKNVQNYKKSLNKNSEMFNHNHDPSMIVSQNSSYTLEVEKQYNSGIVNQKSAGQIDLSDPHPSFRATIVKDRSEKKSSPAVQSQQRSCFLPIVKCLIFLLYAFSYTYQNILMDMASSSQNTDDSSENTASEESSPKEILFNVNVKTILPENEGLISILIHLINVLVCLVCFLFQGNRNFFQHCIEIVKDRSILRLVLFAGLFETLSQLIVFVGFSTNIISSNIFNILLNMEIPITCIFHRYIVTKQPLHNGTWWSIFGISSSTIILSIDVYLKSMETETFHLYNIGSTCVVVVVYLFLLAAFFMKLEEYENSITSSGKYSFVESCMVYNVVVLMYGIVATALLIIKQTNHPVQYYNNYIWIALVLYCAEEWIMFFLVQLMDSTYLSLINCLLPLIGYAFFHYTNQVNPTLYTTVLISVTNICIIFVYSSFQEEDE